MRKKGLLYGAMILTIANLLTKFIGFFYRIYMSNTIGAEGMGLYQLVTPIYMLAWSITSSGFTTTISKLTAQENAKKEYGNMALILKISLIICLSISVIISCTLFYFAEFISLNIIKDVRTLLSLKILAFAIPFMSLGSCIRGYFLGEKNSLVPATSQVFEQIIRIAAIASLAPFFISYGLSYACAAAVIGIVFGEVLSFLYVLILYIYSKDKEKIEKVPSFTINKATNLILAMALPLTANRVVSSLLSTVENILIPQRLQLYLKGEDAITTFGSLTGMAMPLIFFPSAFLVSFSIALVPVISEEVAVKNLSKMKNTIHKAITYTFVIGIGTAMIFAMFPYEISTIIYKDDIVCDMLFKLSFICPFLYLHITLAGILNGLGEHNFIFINNVISSIISILFIYFLTPLIGINSFILGWFTSLTITNYLCYKRVNKRITIKTKVVSNVFYCVISSLAAGFFVKYILNVLSPTSAIVSFLIISSVLIIYALFLMLLGVLKLKDFKI